MKYFKLGNITIAEFTPPVIIAEIGINHNGNLQEAIKIADKAIKSGADIIKHQTHVVSDEMALSAKRVIPGNSTKSIYDIIEKCSLNEEDEFKLMSYVKKKKKIFISTPFSRAAVDRLVKFKVPGFKIGSGECNNYPLVEYIAKKNKPIILSTGMNDYQSIDKSVKIFKKFGLNFALMHCTNLYPTPNHLTRLECVKEMTKRYKSSVIGYSDHTVGNVAALSAVALGAKVIEKHFTLNKNYSNFRDHKLSADPSEMEDLVKNIRSLELMLGSGEKKLQNSEKKNLKLLRRRPVATRNLFKNKKIKVEDIKWIRTKSKINDSAIKNINIINKRSKINIYKNQIIFSKNLK